MSGMRNFLLAFVLAASSVSAARAQGIVDATGRTIPVPAEVRKVLPAGPPASVLLYTLAPDLSVGWISVPKPAELPFLLPGSADKPELGRLTGKGGTANLESVLKYEPDLIIDSGTINDTYISLAEKVQTQTGIPYALLDGSLPKIAESYRTLGRLLHREARAEELAAYAEKLIGDVRGRIAKIPADKRPRFYYARGPEGLSTGVRGSITTEALEFLGAVNVADAGAGLSDVSPEQILAWDPDIIVTIDGGFASRVYANPLWAPLRAVKDKRVYLSPRLPYGWIDFPPGANRLIGLRWAAKVLYPDAFPEDIAPLAREFYKLFYQVEPSEADMNKVLAAPATP
jgi:iron complex transport system substrate-binding protein